MCMVKLVAFVPVVRVRYLAAPAIVEKNLNKEVLEKTPILFCHGDSDPMVLPAWGKSSFDKVKEWGAVDARMKVYKGMQHSACEAELNDVAAFVQEVVPGKQ